MTLTDISWALASSFPKELAEFYAFALEADIQEGLNNDHWWVYHHNGSKIQIFRPSRTRPFSERGSSFALCVQGDSSPEPLSAIEQWCLSLLAGGAEIFQEPSLEFFGAECWLLDHEGNIVIIVSPYP